MGLGSRLQSVLDVSSAQGAHNSMWRARVCYADEHRPWRPSGWHPLGVGGSCAGYAALADQVLRTAKLEEACKPAAAQVLLAAETWQPAVPQPWWALHPFWQM